MEIKPVQSLLSSLLLLVAAICLVQDNLADVPSEKRHAGADQHKSHSLILSKTDQAIADSTAVLSVEQWSEVDGTVRRALKWLAARQRHVGSFHTRDSGQPAVTSLCVLAFMSHGHLPGRGIYGESLDRAIDFALSCQQANGLLVRIVPADGNFSSEIGTSAAYNHPITGMMLAEVYGMAEEATAERVRQSILHAISFTEGRQRIYDRLEHPYIDHTKSVATGFPAIVLCERNDFRPNRASDVLSLRFLCSTECR